MSNKYYNYAAGDKVGIIRRGYYDSYVSFQGFYFVKKCNGNDLVLVREHDSHERTFSNRTGLEKNSSRSAEIVSVEQYNIIKDRQERRNLINDKWNDVASFAQRRDLDQLKKAIEELEAMQNTKLVPA